VKNLNLKKTNDKSVKAGRAKGEGDGGVMRLKYFLCMCENRIMKPIEICLKRGEIRR
jgi:hypothetical protein